MAHRNDICTALDGLLKPHLFQDYCPNGLQVEGKAEIDHVITGVTACQALIDEAVNRGADALLVHHGYFWRGEDPCIKGMKGQRIKSLLCADMNLFAYHLPLDCHPTLGNNAGLGRAMGLEEFGPLKSEEIAFPVFLGSFPESRSLSQIAMTLRGVLNREVLVEGEQDIRTVAWCTGGGQGYIESAADAGVDLFVTGEVSEQTIHVARERGVAFIAAGHHATERFGVQAVGDWLAAELGCRHSFIDIPNPA